MSVDSISFILFLGICIIVNYLFPSKLQWVWLLICSLIFYYICAEPISLIYILITVCSIFCATRFFKYNSQKDKTVISNKCILVITIIINIGILAVLKYSNLFLHTYGILVHREQPSIKWIASLGISFYTLQMISYLLDCYWGIAEPYSNPFHLMLYCIYFPQMISGPISRFSELGGQLLLKHEFDYDKVTNGLIQLSLGLLKKLAVANRIAIIIDYLWSDVQMYCGIYIWGTLALYVIQIYMDFSGCMDIVLGASKCLGIDLPTNFKAPLYSKSLQEFWRRWHITLGTWLRDYIMNPILKSKQFITLGNVTKKMFGKKYGKKIPAFLAMFVLWSAMGLWHGNDWKYVVGEGWWFWLIIVLEQIINEQQKGKNKKDTIKVCISFKSIFQVFRTFVLFSVGMMFFKAESIGDAFDRFKWGFLFNFRLERIELIIKMIRTNIGITGLVVLVVSFFLVTIYDYNLYNEVDLIKIIRKKNLIARWSVYLLLVLLIALSYGVTGRGFAYAQF